MNKNMKETNMEWLGKIPEEWELIPLKYGTVTINENNKPVKMTNVLSLTNTLGVVPYEQKGSRGNNSKEDLSQYKLAYKGTLIINSMNLKIGSVGLSEYDGCVSPVYYVLKNNEKTNIRYINYLFKSDFQKYLGKYGKGILEIREKIPMHDVMRSYIPLPKINIQEKIVEYLDKKCLIIDKQIQNNNKSIILLEEYKEKMISNTVISGVKNDETWNELKFKSVFNLRKGLSITKEHLVEEGIPVISYGQIHSKDNMGLKIVESMIRFVSSKFLITNPKGLVKKNDFIFADTSEDLFGCGNSVYVDRDVKIFAGYHTIIAEPKIDFDTKYYGYLFRTNFWRNQIRMEVTGIKLFSISQKILKQVSVFAPPRTKQVEIVKFLDENCSKIDKIIEYRKQIIEKLEEYKKSLIYEVVTGKVEV